MSRAYRVRVSETLRRHVKVEDGVQTKLSLLGILPADRTADLLAAELVARGFSKKKDVLVRSGEDGVEVEIDPQEGTVTIRLVEESELELERKREARVYDIHHGKDQLRKAVKDSLEKEAKQVESDMRQKVTKRLEGALEDIQQELDQVVNRVTIDSLKERAAQLGEIKEISEDQETGSLRILVKV